MIRFILGCAFTLWLSASAQALDLAQMSDDERAAFRDEVRAYLLENPEVIMDAIQVLKDRDAAAAVQNDLTLVQDNATALFSSPADWVGGNKDGDITVIEFMDYRCSYCKKAHDELAELISTDGNIRFVVKEYPILGEQSDLAARFAVAVHQIGGDEAYKSVHETLMVMRADITVPVLERIATDLDLDPAAINARMQSPEVSAVIAANHALGETLQINGTPTFIVQKTMLRGYVPLDGMRQVVTEQRNG